MPVIPTPDKPGHVANSGVLFNHLMREADVSDYRLAPLLVARIMGSYLVVLAVLVFVGTVVVAAAGWSGDLLTGLLAVGLASTFGLAWWLRSRAYVVRFDAEGYRVGLVHGAGVRQASWTDVTEAAATTAGRSPCLELRLRDDRTTTIPVSALAVDRDDFVREVRARLQRGHGLRSR